MRNYDYGVPVGIHAELILEWISIHDGSHCRRVYSKWIGSHTENGLRRTAVTIVSKHGCQDTVAAERDTHRASRRAARIRCVGREDRLLLETGFWMQRIQI